MARSIREMINEALDAAVAQGRITEDDRASIRQFAGLKGAVDGADPQRYYLDAQLSEFVEIALRDVAAEIGLSGDASPNVLVLAKPSVEIHHHQHVVGCIGQEIDFTESIQASFLAGEIAKRHLSATRIGSRFFQNEGARHTHYYTCGCDRDTVHTCLW